VFEKAYLLINQKIKPTIIKIAEIEIHNQPMVSVSNVAPIIKAPIEPKNNPMPCF
jgi:hypothetical protein